MNAQDAESNATPWLNLVGFVLGLAVAWFLKWDTTDLVWSLWLSSLLIGYATIVCTIAAGAVFAGKVAKFSAKGKYASPKASLSLGGIGIGLALFMLGFFSLHFCGFHAGHAVFLGSFFPLPGQGEGFGSFGDAFMNPPKLLWIAITEIAPRYGAFLIPVLIVEWKKVIGPLRMALNFTPKDNPDDEGETNVKKQLPKLTGDPFFAPYKNVIRMHILIFFFAGAHFLKLENFFVYAAVYAVYFFPWSILKKRQSKEQETPVASVAPAPPTGRPSLDLGS